MTSYIQFLLKGHRFRVPTAGVTVGVSSIAEIQIDGISYQSLNVTTRVEAPLSRLLQFSGDTTYDMDDIVVGAKARVLSEGRRRPAVALRFATRLPNAGNESGLGLATTDFINTVLVGNTFGAVRVVGRHRKWTWRGYLSPEVEMRWQAGYGGFRRTVKAADDGQTD